MTFIFQVSLWFFSLVYMTELWVSQSSLYANNQNITVPSECHFMFEGRFPPKHRGLLKTFQVEQHELFSLNKNRKSHNDFRGFIFATAELLGCAFKLHFTFLRRASVNIRTYSLCTEKEKKNLLLWHVSVLELGRELSRFRI